MALQIQVAQEVSIVFGIVHTDVELLVILDVALEVVVDHDAFVVAAYYVLVGHLELLDG